MTYAFILGRNAALSVAEILSVLKRDHFVFVSLSISSNALIIKTDKLIDNPQDFLNRLGGSIKMAQVFTESEENNIQGPILGYITSNFRESKFVFSISSYGVRSGKIGYEIKRMLKGVGINSRLVLGKEEALSAPEIKNNKIIEKGADFILIRNQKKIIIGKTLAIQDYEAYSARDYDRPRRNAKSGMLPPKVAQAMINMVPSLKTNMIYDPFCGQGTILQEALLMGIKVLGSDLSSERVYDTKKNLEWLSQKYKVEVVPEKIIFQFDALALSKKNLPAHPDAIISEVYLGPPLTAKASEESLKRISDDLEKEYLAFLKNARDLGIGYLTLALPFFITKNKRYLLNIFDASLKMGYNVIDPFENIGIDFNLLPEYQKDRKTILYSRPDQVVGREIVILEKK